MVRSKATSAHTLMVKEIDYDSGRTRARATRRVRSESSEGVQSQLLALQCHRGHRSAPRFSTSERSSAGDDELIVHLDVNLGIAVDIDNEGLVVPVLRGADRLDLKQIARSVRDGAERARSMRLGTDELFWRNVHDLESWPVRYIAYRRHHQINRKWRSFRPTRSSASRSSSPTRTGRSQVGIHSVGLLALNFDHRAVDGAYAARFLSRMSEILTVRNWAEDFA